MRVDSCYHVRGLPIKSFSFHDKHQCRFKFWCPVVIPDACMTRLWLIAYSLSAVQLSATAAPLLPWCRTISVAVIPDLSCCIFKTLWKNFQSLNLQVMGWHAARKSNINMSLPQTGYLGCANVQVCHVIDEEKTSTFALSACLQESVLHTSRDKPIYKHEIQNNRFMARHNNNNNITITGITITLSK